VELLKQNAIKWGYWLRSQNTNEQIREVIKHWQLLPAIHAFSRCLECNGSLIQEKKEAVWEKLPPQTRLDFNEFYQCSGCGKVYWKGSHYDRMMGFIEELKKE
jgi:uncharacterized protein